MGKVLLELNTETIYKQIHEELGKTEKEIQEYVTILQEWLKTQEHLPEVPGTELIRSFLIFNKFSIEKCKIKLDLYYTVRCVMPELFNKHPCTQEMVEQARITYVIPLPKLSNDNRRILYTKISEVYGTEAFNHERFTSHIFNVFEILVREDLFLGSHFIYDCAGLKMGHVTKLSPTVMKKSSVVMEKVFSNRVTSVHIVNFHPAFEATLNIVKAILPPKIQARLKVHKSAATLFDTFSKEILPKDIGGEEDSLADLTELWIQELKSQSELFTKLQNMKVDESKRPSKLVNDEILGFYGSFRKIDVD